MGDFDDMRRPPSKKGAALEMHRSKDTLKIITSMISSVEKSEIAGQESAG